MAANFAAAANQSKLANTAALRTSYRNFVPSSRRSGHSHNSVKTSCLDLASP